MLQKLYASLDEKELLPETGISASDEVQYESAIYTFEQYGDTLKYIDQINTHGYHSKDPMDTALYVFSVICSHLLYVACATFHLVLRSFSWTPCICCIISCKQYIAATVASFDPGSVTPHVVLVTLRCAVLCGADCVMLCSVVLTVLPVTLP